MSEPDELIAFKFEGGIAHIGTMNFYSASRFQYGAARFLLKTAHYQQTGRVLQRVTVKIDADYRIIATEHGSWIQRVWDFGSDLATKKYITVPVKTIFNFAMKKLTTKKTPDSIILELERVKLDQDKVALERDKTIERLANKVFESDQRLIDHLEAENARLLDQQCEPIQKIIENNVKSLIAEKNIEQEIKPYRPLLDAADEEGDISKLIHYNEGSISDMLLPVANQNVDRLLIGKGDFDDYSGIGDQSTIDRLEGVEVSEETVALEGTIKSYDFETGFGKFRNARFPGAIKFAVERTIRKFVEPDVIAAAQTRKGSFVFRYVVNSRSGEIERLILEKVIDYGN